jgi:eukaryotic-like serine/threonine-protein kinase
MPSAGNPSRRRTDLRVEGTSATCPAPHLLEAFATGAVTIDERRVLESHIDRCPGCSQLVAELARVYCDSGADPTVDARAITEQQELGAGAWAGRYQLRRRVGAGGMGVVFEAFDPELERHVAIKLLHPGSRGVTRLHREARAMARLTHPNVVAVYDIGSVGAQVFIAMELVRGTTLTRWLRARARSRWQVLDVFRAAGRGLEAAHAVGIIHRDFKPDNVLIGEDGRARVTDFGLARPLETIEATAGLPAASPEEGAITRTVPGAMVGTPAYMAPEQLRGQQADAQSDQFAYCVSLFESLFGRRPFDGRSVTELRDNVLNGRRAPIPNKAGRRLRAVLQCGLSLRPQDRYPAMTALLADLDRVRRPRRLRFALPIALLFSAGAASWWGLKSNGGPFDDSCGRALVRQRFGEERQRLLRQNMSSRKAFISAEATAPLEQLQSWATAWTQAHQACGESDAPLRAKRQRCLERRFLDFEAMVNALIESDGHEIERSFAAVPRLPRPTECESAPRIEIQPMLPAEDATRATVELLEGDMASLRAVLTLGMGLDTSYGTKELEEKAAALENRAAALGHKPTLAEAQLLHGRLLLASSHTEEAARKLAEAVASAKASGHDEVIAEVSIAMLAIEAQRLHPRAGEQWLRFVRSTSSRFGDERFEIEATLGEARLLRATGSYDDARALFAKGLEMRRKLFGDTHVLVAESRIELSEVLVDLGDHQAAHDEASKALSACLALTPRGLPTGAARTAVGRALLALNKPAQALDELDKAKSDFMLATSGNYEPASITMALLAQAHLALGHHDEAMQQFRIATFDAIDIVLKASLQAAHGDALVATGDSAKGLELYRQAEEALEQAFGKEDPRLVSLLRKWARALLTVRKPAEARRLLTRARGIVEQHIGQDALWAFVLNDLADAEEMAGRKREALSLLDTANLSLVGAYEHPLGPNNPLATRQLLRRADLAWEVGRREHAAILYRAVSRRFAEGTEEGDRARSRAAPERLLGDVKP